MQDTEKGTIRGRTRTWLHKTKKQRCCRSWGIMRKNMSGTQNIHRSSTARGLTRRKPLSAIERGPEPMQENMQGNMQENMQETVQDTAQENMQETEQDIAQENVQDTCRRPSRISRRRT